MQITVATWIAASPERVFSVAADIPRWPQHIAAITRVEILTPGPVAVGTRFTETRTMFGREAVEEMTVAEITPPARLVLTAESHGTRYRAVHTFTPDGEGTRLTLEFDGVPVTLAARLMTPLAWMMRRQIKSQLAADLVDLKRVAEG